MTKARTQQQHGPRVWSQETEWKKEEVREVTEGTQFLVYLGNGDQSGRATPTEAGGAFGHR